MLRLLAASLLAVPLSTAGVSAREFCRFTGVTSYDGHVAVTTDVAEADGGIRVDVTARFDASGPLWLNVDYLAEEVSTWRAGALQSVAVNTRYLLGGHIVRQQWDVFERAPTGLAARRVQAKTLVDFRRRHGGFARHWDPATFGLPWTDDYHAAAPERRPDLDLAAAPLPAGLRSPLALAFYWIRWLPAGGENVPVFLPGFKSDRLVEVPVAAASAGGMTWRAVLRHPALDQSPASTAGAWLSPDHHLVQLAFDLHASAGSGRGVIRQAGCEGSPVIPVDPRHTAWSR